MGLDILCGVAHGATVPADLIMSEAPAVHGIEIVEIVSNSPNGIPLDQLAEIVAARFGKSAKFYTIGRAASQVGNQIRRGL